MERVVGGEGGMRGTGARGLGGQRGLGVQRGFGSATVHVWGHWVLQDAPSSFAIASSWARSAARLFSSSRACSVRKVRMASFSSRMTLAKSTFCFLFSFTPLLAVDAPPMLKAGGAEGGAVEGGAEPAGVEE